MGFEERSAVEREPGSGEAGEDGKSRCHISAVSDKARKPGGSVADTCYREAGLAYEEDVVEHSRNTSYRASSLSTHVRVLVCARL